MSTILYILLFIGIMYLMNKGDMGCCGGHNHNDRTYEKNGNMEHHHGDNNMNNIEMVKDPVCGMHIPADKAVTKVINGKRYYFCSETCAKEFENK
ncbi:YHS domain-containing protein [Thermoanaerobacterium thermosaccharolyticum]|uniref:TRASH domain-containing protein n=1 Tax=Thermoanaerobacterium thermosaccharolyticum M0795 TaxID=698948 RepID=L0IHT9_THETR|nr:YHS domain-containing protein [Thermoanaerobacterium thermosaccharolyticum]AGB18403.1 hypothetical protein Thethe_00716 [Thermoanaerobacterium thermosaccharolyticum M0795]